jgi:hypothetical protein
VLRVASVLLLVLGGLAVYRIDLRPKHPHFAVGGGFAAKGAGVPVTGTDAGAPSTGATTTAVTAAGDSSTTAKAAASRPVSSVASTVTPGGAAPSTPATTLPAPRPGASPWTPAALGTYIYNVQGSEQATGFGGRAFPAQMTMTVHGSSGVDPATQDVVDLAYSANHNEREIVQWTPQGVAFIFEGGQVQFGPVSQVNQGTYTPPMVQIAAPLVAGTTQRGKTQVYSGSTLERVEDWTVAVLGQDTVMVGTTAIPTVKVQIDRQSEPGAAQQTTRNTTFWYDPSRRIWIKFAEKENGWQTVVGLKFTYSNDLTATLASYTPAT